MFYIAQIVCALCTTSWQAAEAEAAANAALELLPANVLALRTAAGSEDAYIVVLPTFIASVISFVSAAAICALLCRIMPQRPIGKGKA